MPDPWIRVRTSLAEDEAVRAIASWLMSPGTLGGTIAGTSKRLFRRLAVGMLVDFWSWAHEQNRGGVIANADLEDVDDVVGVAGFGKQLVAVGWMSLENSDLRLTKHEKLIGSRHDSRESWKNKKRKQRDTDGDNGGDVPRDVPADIDGDLLTSSSNSSSSTVPSRKRGKPKVVSVEELPKAAAARAAEWASLSPPVQDALREFARYRDTRPKGSEPLDAQALERHIRWAAQFGDAYGAAVEESIANRWVGVRKDQLEQHAARGRSSGPERLTRRAALQKSNTDAARAFVEAHESGAPPTPLLDLEQSRREVS